MIKTTFLRKDLTILKTTNRDNPAYVLVMAHPAPGVLEYAGTTLRDVIDDEEKCLDAMVKVFNDLYSDVTILLWLLFSSSS